MSGLLRHSIRAARSVQYLSKRAATYTLSSFQTRGFSTPHPSESFATGSSAVYAEQMYEAWLRDPNSVHVSWASYFTNLQNGLEPGAAVQLPPALGGSSAALSQQASGGFDMKALSDHIKVHLLVRAYQVRGHAIAKLDPLGLYNADLSSHVPVELDYKTYGFTEADLDREFFLGTEQLTGFLSSDRRVQKLRTIISRLEETYCNSIGFEYMHIDDRDMCNFLRERIETPTKYVMDNKEKETVLVRVARAELFEKFLAQKFTTHKRFGLEGCEALIPGMEALIETGVQLGLESIVMGMPHRGRLNVLSNVVRKPYERIFADFEGHKSQTKYGSGDVKYHLGMSHTRTYPDGKSINVSLVANPSHLEAVDPVVEGKARAKQYYTKDTTRKKVMSVLLHGDAAFSGQGVVYETMGLSDLRDYTTGGTIHIIVNNQIGFTTNPRSSRSSPYCSDLAKAFNAPVFHVNGDDPEAVVRACKLAVEWRQRYGKDVVIDIVCYRRYGHNELDQPSFTQPLMYKAIAKQPTTLDLYSAKLLKEGVVNQETVDNIQQKIKDELSAAFDRSRSNTAKTEEWLDKNWKNFKSPENFSAIRNTGVPMEILKKAGAALVNIPEGFTLHPQIAKIIAQKKKMVETGQDVDWATAEALAFGTLLLEGNHVRLSGQDVERGTFSHRHAALVDQITEASYVPLNNIEPGQKENFVVTNSNLSEYGVLGFELGYSLEDPRSLIMWEAQFGDFANTAQVIIDQFISSGEMKWLRQSGLTMLLPHGYDGQGPEHSSARLERFLQMTDEDPDVIPDMTHEKRTQIQNTNWQVVYCTTPANFFHVLRRQCHREFRKPMVCMVSKSLLRHPLAKSNFDEFVVGTRFKRVIGEVDEIAPADEVKRGIFCTGQIYYALLEHRRLHKIDNVAIIRVEQLSPFPFDHVAQQAAKYKNAEVMWCQEEPKNMGAWTYVFFRFETTMRELVDKQRAEGHRRIRYVGRAAAAATATGWPATHKQEHEQILQEAFKF